MKKLLLSLVLFSLLGIGAAQAATTYYVRPDGGTQAQCTGVVDAAYPGSGTAQACAYSHPAWVMAGTGGVQKWVGGDTMIIDDVSGTAQYAAGYGMPNTSGCSLFAPQNCFLNTIPQGPDVNHPTRILGKKWNVGCALKPQLYGVESTSQVLKTQQANNIDIECVEITDHSACGFRVGQTKCSENYNGSSVGSYGRNGIGGAGAANFIMKNVDIHGMAKEALAVSDLSGTSYIYNVNIDGNYFSGWDADQRFVYGGSGAINTGTMILDRVNMRYNGCKENYPRSGSFADADYNNCTDQNDNPPGYGDAFGSFDTSGTFIVTRSNISHNASDGWDLLYCVNCSIYMDKITAEGNNGNQLKFSATTLRLTNSLIVANCKYLRDTGKVYNTSTWSDCRANGSPISSTTVKGSNWLIENVTAYSGNGFNGSPFIEVVSRYGTCNGTESYTYKNNILYSPDAIWVPYYNGLSGACSTAWQASTTTYSNINHFQTTVSGTGNSSAAPAFAGTFSGSAVSNRTALLLSSGSPGKGTGNAGTYWNDSKDLNGFPQNGSVDMGAQAFGTSVVLAQPGQPCVATSDCANGTCSGFACSGGGCVANAGGCTVGVTNCCSGYCNGSACANPPTCGDGLIGPGELCDGSNLGGSNCIIQGFQSGTLTCAADCLSFNTGSCSASTTFPLSPIIDDFNRANAGPPASSSWSNIFGDGNKVVSNTLGLVTGSNGETGDYFNANSAVADQEVYATVSTLGNFALYGRVNSSATNGYVAYYDNVAHTFGIARLDPGTFVNLHTYSSVTLSAGDKLGISIIGSTIKNYKYTSGAWSLLGSFSDATYASGAFGVYMDNTTVRLDNFGGGNVNPVVCGNGLKEFGEACDGTDLATQTCVTQNFASGTLACASNCLTFNTSSCVTASVCGNGSKENGEICDGAALDSQTCTGLGYASGSLSCAADCLSYVTTGCVAGGAAGNGFGGGTVMK